MKVKRKAIEQKKQPKQAREEEREKRKGARVGKGRTKFSFC